MITGHTDCFHPDQSGFLFLKRPHAKHIGLIADTHVPDRSASLSSAVYTIFSNVDLILHAGDISSPEVIEALGKMAEVIAVRGNNRGDRKRFPKPLPEICMIDAAFGTEIVLYHGLDHYLQRPGDVIQGRLGFADRCVRRVAGRVGRKFRNPGVIVFGHAHWPYVMRDGGTLFVNPGKAFGRRESSCAVMQLGPRCIRIEIIELGIPGRISQITGRTFEFPGINEW